MSSGRGKLVQILRDATVMLDLHPDHERLADAVLNAGWRPPLRDPRIVSETWVDGDGIHRHSNCRGFACKVPNCRDSKVAKRDGSKPNSVAEDFPVQFVVERRGSDDAARRWAHRRGAPSWWIVTRPDPHTVVYAVGTGVIACSCGLTFHAERLGVTFPRDAVTLWNEHRARELGGDG